MGSLYYLLHHCKVDTYYQGRSGARELAMADAVPLQDVRIHTDFVLVVAVVVAAARDTRYYYCCYAIVVGLLAA